MRYDLTKNTITGGCDCFSLIDWLKNDQKRGDTQIFSDLVDRIMDGSWDRFIDAWNLDAGDTADAIAQYIRLVSKARIANDVLRPGKITRR